MADRFIDLTWNTSDADLADAAVARLVAQWPDYEPNDGDPEVVLIEALAPMASDVARAASRVPAAIFREYGQKLRRTPYRAGLYATGSVEFTMMDDAGYVLESGIGISIDDVGFATTSVLTIEPGSTTGVVGIRATEEGVVGNGKTAASATSILSSVARVDSIEVVGVTSGGVDPETDDEYQDRLSLELELQAKTLVTERDFQFEALADPRVGRALASHLGQRNIRVSAVDHDGEPVSSQVKDDLTAIYADYRLVNTVVTWTDPTYTTMDVDWEVERYPNYDPAAMEAAINAALGEFFSPRIWGTPPIDGEAPRYPQWVLEPVVWRNKVIDLIGNVPGVNVVHDVTLTGSGGTASGGNWQLPGDVPLTRAGVFSGVVTS